LAPTDAILVINALNGDHVTPLVTTALKNDTAIDGTTNTDGVTSDPTIAGSVADLTGATVVHAQVDAGSIVDLPVDWKDQFVFSPTLADGRHTVRFTAEDGV